MNARDVVCSSSDLPKLRRFCTIVSVNHLSLETSQVLEGQGIPPSHASPPLEEAAEEILGEAHALLDPAALYAIFSVHDFEHQQVVLDNGAAFGGPLVARALAGAIEVAVAVCTIGSALEERMSALFASGDAMRALALEGAGIAAIRQLSMATGIQICDAATARGLSVGMRASPGQEGWSIQQQRVLFDLSPAEEIGVRLTPSVSFVIGLGPEMRADSVPCDFCSKRERCHWRHEKSVTE